MFKEKYLIFKDVPRSAPHGEPKPKEGVPQNLKKARTEHADKNLAEDMVLTPERQADIFTLRFVMPHLLRSYPNRDKDSIYKSDMVQDELIPVLEAAYVGACNYSFHPNEHGFVLKSDNPDFDDMVFDFTQYDSHLNYPGKKPEKTPEKVAKKGETPEKAKELAEKFIKEHMLAYLKSKRPRINSDKGLMTNYMMTQEVKPILEAGYERGKSYKFYESAEGFMLKSEDDEQRFDLSDYDDYLKLKGLKFNQTKENEAPENETDDQKMRRLKTQNELNEIEMRKIENAEMEKAKSKYGAQMEYMKKTPNISLVDLKQQISTIAKQNEEIASIERDLMEYIDAIQKLGSDQYTDEERNQLRQTKKNLELNFEATVEAARENNDYDTLAALGVIEEMAEKSDLARADHGNHGHGGHGEHGHEEPHPIPDDYTDENGRRLDDDSDL